MITLAFQIYFGVRAFKNGWSWRVLLPCGIALFTSLFIGFVSALAGEDTTAAFPILLLVDIGLICVLAHMARHARVGHDTMPGQISPAGPPIA